MHHFIWEMKQKMTLEVINEKYLPDDRIVNILKHKRNMERNKPEAKVLDEFCFFRDYL